MYCDSLVPLDPPLGTPVQFAMYVPAEIETQQCGRHGFGLLVISSHLQIGRGYEVVGVFSETHLRR
jgi:hypothetical protein